MYCIAQSFGGRKLWGIAAQKHFGRKNISGLAALLARIKVVSGCNFDGLVVNCQMHPSVLLPKALCHTYSTSFIVSIVR